MEANEFFTGPAGPFPGRFPQEHPMPVQQRILAIYDFMYREFSEQQIFFKEVQHIMHEDQVQVSILGVKATPAPREELWIITDTGKWNIVHQAQILSGTICDTLRSALLKCKDGQLDYQHSYTYK